MGRSVRRRTLLLVVLARNLVASSTGHCCGELPPRCVAKRLLMLFLCFGVLRLSLLSFKSCEDKKGEKSYLKEKTKAEQQYQQQTQTQNPYMLESRNSLSSGFLAAMGEPILRNNFVANCLRRLAHIVASAMTNGNLVVGMLTATLLKQI